MVIRKHFHFPKLKALQCQRQSKQNQQQIDTVQHMHTVWTAAVTDSNGKHFLAGTRGERRGDIIFVLEKAGEHLNLQKTLNLSHFHIIYNIYSYSTYCTNVEKFATLTAYCISCQINYCVAQHLMHVFD